MPLHGIAAIALGSFAYRAAGLFTGSGTASHSVASAQLTLSSTGSTFTADVTGLLPGAAALRKIELDPGGSGDIGGVTLTTVATSSSALDTDAVNGLQLEIARCSTAWAGSDDSYTCGGSESVVLALGPVIRSGVALASLDLAAGAHNYLVAGIALPNTAGGTVANLSSTIQFTFATHQRAGTSK